ncbi:MAG: ATPase domain-containing protein, partial [Acidimicrobiales bacterium]
MPRAPGLPGRGQAAVFPVLDATGAPTYLQARYLDEEAAGRRYDNPDQSRYAKSPRLAVLPPPPTGGAGDPGLVIICEGFPDAYTVTGAGHQAVAVLGAGYPDEAVAAQVVSSFPPDHHLVLAFDADQRGRSGSEALAIYLAGAGAGRRVWDLAVPEAHGDLNAWATASGEAFAEELSLALDEASPAGWEPVRSAADLWEGFLATQADRSGAIAIPTGVTGLDQAMAFGGWRPGVVLLGGLAGVGKSAFSLYTALHAARSGHPVVYVSVEQGPNEVLGRLVCK